MSKHIVFIITIVWTLGWLPTHQAFAQSAEAGGEVLSTEPEETALGRDSSDVNPAAVKTPAEQVPTLQSDTLPGEDFYFVNDSMPPIVADYDSIAAEIEAYNAQKFNPVPARAVWYAALFPGGGQIYNRKYWKLPIIYGGYLGLIYGYQWNQRYYKTYSNAYRDLVLNSPNASYKDFLPPNYDVEGRRDYLERVFKRKKNSYRNYRDYCIVGMIGIYLVAMVDAYVDASLYHFDVSPELGADNRPTLMIGYTYNF